MSETSDDLSEKSILAEPLGRPIGERYLTYALSTIMNRALPDARDGLKPVHRRILFAMRELKLNATGGFRKSAKIAAMLWGIIIPTVMPPYTTLWHDWLKSLMSDPPLLMGRVIVET